MMTKQFSKPANEARPLGTKRAATKGKHHKGVKRSAKRAVKNTSPAAAETPCTIDPVPLTFDHAETTREAITPTAITPNISKDRTMNLQLKGTNKRGTQAIYTGLRTAIRVPLSAFVDKKAPATFEVSGAFAEGRASRAKLTPEERRAQRKAQPKLTLAEKVQKAEERAARLREKLAANAGANQPAL